MRQFNLRLMLILAGMFLAVAVGMHFLHGYQVRRNSFAFLQRARQSEKEIRELIEKKEGTPREIERLVRSTIQNYRRYLGLQQDDDIDVRIDYAKFLLAAGDLRGAYAQNERILRGH